MLHVLARLQAAGVRTFSSPLVRDSQSVRSIKGLAYLPGWGQQIGINRFGVIHVDIYVAMGKVASIGGIREILKADATPPPPPRPRPQG